MKIKKGDLIKLAQAGEFDIIVHGCNCQGKMGAGIAKQIKKAFPVAYYADQDYHKGGKACLGNISVSATLTNHGMLYIVNAYTQLNYNRNGQQVDYDAIRQCFNKIKIIADKNRIGYPKIGAGLGGGDWEIIRKIIDEELEGTDHTLVELD